MDAQALTSGRAGLASVRLASVASGQKRRADDSELPAGNTRPVTRNPHQRGARPGRPTLIVVPAPTPVKALAIADTPIRVSRENKVVAACDLFAVSLVIVVSAGLFGWPLPTIMGAAAALALAQPSHRRYRFAPSAVDDLPRQIVGVAVVTVGAVLGVQALSGPVPPVLCIGGLLLAAAWLARVVGYGIVLRTRRRGSVSRAAVIVGGGKVGERLASGLQDPSRGVRLVGVVDYAGRADSFAPHLGSPEALTTVVANHRVDLVLVAFGAGPTDVLIEALRQLDGVDCEVHVVPRLFELSDVSRGVQLVDGVPLVRLRRAARRSVSWKVKRVIDVLGAAFGLILASPLLAVAALAVRFEGGPGVIFRQKRIGLDGKPFTLYKLRSMRPEQGEAEVRWNIDRDPRLGTVGRFIRRTSIDELPQFYNVLKGDMSLVGPRPERPYFVDKFNQTIPGYRHRHRVPVGLTGLAVVHGLRGDTSIPDRAHFDNAYAESWSLWLDIKIMLLTVRGTVSRG